MYKKIVIPTILSVGLSHLACMNVLASEINHANATPTLKSISDSVLASGNNQPADAPTLADKPTNDSLAPQQQEQQSLGLAISKSLQPQSLETITPEDITGDSIKSALTTPQSTQTPAKTSEEVDITPQQISNAKQQIEENERKEKKFVMAILLILLGGLGIFITLYRIYKKQS